MRSPTPAAPPDPTDPGPRTAAIIEVAGNRLTAAYAAALPAGLHLVDDVVWGPPPTDRAQLAREALPWRDRAGIADIVARTGLWRPPDPDVMPRVRIEGRRDEVTPTGHRLGQLATRDTAQYWAVYGELPNGLLDLAADFATEQAARRYAARWGRPGSLVYADHTQDLPAPQPALAVMGRRPRSWHPRPVHRSTPPPRGLHT